MEEQAKQIDLLGESELFELRGDSIKPQYPVVDIIPEEVKRTWGDSEGQQELEL